MNITLESDGVYFQTDSSGNKLIFKQGTNNPVTFAEYTGTATFLTTPIHPTPITSANDTQSATTAYVRAYRQSLVAPFNPDQSSSIGGAPTTSAVVKASTLSFDYPLIADGSSLSVNNIVFTAIYLSAGMQFNKYNFISGLASGTIPFRFALFDPSYNYVLNSDTGGYNSSPASLGAILTSPITNTVTIPTTGVYYIFYQSRASVAGGAYYSGGPAGGQHVNITNFWRTTGTLSSNGPFRSFFINGNNEIVPSSFGNIGTKAITGWLSRIHFIFLSL